MLNGSGVIMKKISMFAIGALTALVFVDCFAGTSVSEALNPVKKEINDMVDFGLVIVWLVGVFWGVAWKGFFQSNIFAAAIGIIIPSICTALALIHKFA